MLSYEHRHPFTNSRKESSKTLLSYKHRHHFESYSPPTKTLLSFEHRHHFRGDARETLYGERHKSPAGYTTYEGHKLG